MSDGRIVIIEGTDCTGKTTLANELARRTGARTAVLHAGPPATNVALREYVLPLAMADDGWTVICDRWHLGELVWAELYKRTPLFSHEGIAYVEIAMLGVGVPITAVYLHRDETHIQLELLERGENSPETFQAIDLYKKALAASTLSWNIWTLTQALDEIDAVVR